MIRKRSILLLIMLMLTVAVHSIQNEQAEKYVFENLMYKAELIENSNSFPCDQITRVDLEHILNTGVLVTHREIHDHYLYIGCVIKGSVEINNKVTNFRFDYGGVFYFEDGKVLACGEKCCLKKGFEYCSWERDGLK